MPKGNGAAQAFKADEQTLADSERLHQPGAAHSLPEGAKKKINITIPLQTLYNADLKLLELKRKGQTIDRSAYITALIDQDVGQEN